MMQATTASPCLHGWTRDEANDERSICNAIRQLGHCDTIRAIPGPLQRTDGVMPDERYLVRRLAGDTFGCDE